MAPPPTALLIPPSDAPTTVFSLFLAILRARGFEGVVAARGDGGDNAAEAGLVRRRLLGPLVEALSRRVLVFAAGDGAGVVAGMAGPELGAGWRSARGMEGGVICAVVLAGESELNRQTAGLPGAPGVPWMLDVPRTYVRAVLDSRVSPEAQTGESQHRGFDWDVVDLMVPADAYDAGMGDVAQVVDVCARKWAELV